MDPGLRQRMARHVQDLADEHGIPVTWKPGWRNAEAFPSIPAITVPVIRSPRDYLVALHELGHVLSPESASLHDTPGPMWSYLGIVSEGAAWAWAATAAKPALVRHFRAKDWDAVAYAFRTYLQLAAAEDPGELLFPGASAKVRATLPTVRTTRPAAA